jgi:hypothetical protein
MKQNEFNFPEVIYVPDNDYYPESFKKLISNGNFTFDGIEGKYYGNEKDYYIMAIDNNLCSYADIDGPIQFNYFLSPDAAIVWANGIYNRRLFNAKRSIETVTKILDKGFKIEEEEE